MIWVYRRGMMPTLRCLAARGIGTKATRNWSGLAEGPRQEGSLGRGGWGIFNFECTICHRTTQGCIGCTDCCQVIQRAGLPGFGHQAVTASVLHEFNICAALRPWATPCRCWTTPPCLCPSQGGSTALSSSCSRTPGPT